MSSRIEAPEIIFGYNLCQETYTNEKDKLKLQFLSLSETFWRKAELQEQDQ
jgi:hypothetical protein